MINDAHVFLAGYVATQPTCSQVGGRSVTKLRVGYTSRRLDRETGEWTDGPTSFVGVECWRTLADNAAVCLRKGDPVLVRGRLQVRRYQNSDGAPRIAVEVEANSIGHDLSRGVAHFSRTRRSAGETAAELADSAARAAGTAPDGAPADGPSADSPSAGGESAGPVGEPLAGPGDVVDERAVEELARELSDSIDGDPELSESMDADRELSAPV